MRHLPSATAMLRPVCSVELRRLDNRDAAELGRELLEMVADRLENYSIAEGLAIDAGYAGEALVKRLDEEEAEGSDDDDQEDDDE